MAAHTRSEHPTARRPSDRSGGGPVRGAGAHAGRSTGEEHESFIRTPKQLIIVVLLALLVPVVVIILLANFVSAGNQIGAGAGSMQPESVAARIEPVAGFMLRDANSPIAARAAEEVFKGVCSACHTAGVAGAPKLGDKAAWSPRNAQGLEVLVASSLKGKGAMPAQGGGDYSETEIAKAVVYMANAGGGNFEEPKAEPAPAPAGK